MTRKIAPLPLGEGRAKRRVRVAGLPSLRHSILPRNSIFDVDSQHHFTEDNNHG